MAPLDTICPGSAVTKHEYEQLVSRLLQAVEYRLPELETQGTVNANVLHHLRNMNVPDDLIVRLQGAIGTAVCISQSAYSFLPSNVQETVALYAAITIGIDDIAHEIKGPLRRYASELVKRQKHGHVLLDALTMWLGTNADGFGNFARDMLVKASVDFVSACYYEEDEPSLGGTLNAPGFAEYFRYKSGDSEAFAFLLFPEQLFPEKKFLRQYLPAIPYIVEYMNLVNDILSFYKEEQKDGERGNFVHTYALTEGITVLEALEAVEQRSIRAFQRIESILKCDKTLYQSALSFLHGYLAFHLGQRRYRLIELNIPAARTARNALEHCKSTTAIESHCT